MHTHRHAHCAGWVWKMNQVKGTKSPILSILSPYILLIPALTVDLTFHTLIPFNSVPVAALRPSQDQLILLTFLPAPDMLVDDFGNTGFWVQPELYAFLTH